MLESQAIQTRDSFVYNHVTPSLSELDLEIIRSVPPGGNWQDIPLRIAKKSARVMQIRRSGGRTTYYGRLRPDMPSYTVNTYFFRPGNGSFIHYSQDRMISLREAARLQSFPDDFVFHGPFTSVSKQIGNAVPPLLARAVGLSLRPGPSVDLFAGAGGLSLGLRESGHQVLVAAEMAPYMCSTYKANHPNTQVFCSDLTREESYLEMIQAVENALHGRSLTLLAGGPPCQGFSTAGHWNEQDLRNDLVMVMLRAVDEFQPEQVLIENVPGIQWISRGQFLQRVLETLSRAGYTHHHSVLKAEQYGVPQRRRRVFIVGTRDGEPWVPPEPRFAAIPRGMKTPQFLSSSDLPFSVTVEEAISDLPPLTPGEGDEPLVYDPGWARTNYQRLMHRMVTYERFLDGQSELKVI